MLQADANDTWSARHKLALSVLGLGFLVFPFKTNGKPAFSPSDLGSFLGWFLGPSWGAFWYLFWVHFGPHFGAFFGLFFQHVFGPPQERHLFAFLVFSGALFGQFSSDFEVILGPLGPSFEKQRFI